MLTSPSLSLGSLSPKVGHAVYLPVVVTRLTLSPAKRSLSSEVHWTQVEDPVARVDILEQGGRYIESTEDFLRRTGHWLETEPPEEEIDAQLASDFADFAEPELRALR